IGCMLPFDLLLLAGELRGYHLLDAIAVLNVSGRENAAERHLAAAAGVGRETSELDIEVRLDDMESKLVRIELVRGRDHFLHVHADAVGCTRIERLRRRDYDLTLGDERRREF